MPQVLIILGSKNDAAVGRKAVDMLRQFGISSEMAVASAHRSPRRVAKLVSESDAEVFIAMAGLSAALPGAVAASTVKPVIGVPISGKLNLDCILSIVQMPGGIPVAAVGLDRADNAAILAAQILSLKDKHLAEKLISYRKDLEASVENDSREVSKDVQS